MAFARPSSDVVDGAFVPSTGGDLYACIDETSPSDADYIAATEVTSGTVGLSSVVDPLSPNGHTYSFRATSADGSTLVCRLRQGATQVATETVSNVPVGFTTYARTLTAAEADSITDYTALRLEFETLRAPSAMWLLENGVDFWLTEDGSYWEQG